MTEFRNHVEQILCNEISKVIEQQGYFLETEFCDTICEKHNLSIHTLRPTLRSIYPEMNLIKRRMSDELRDFYHLKIAGHPIMYLHDKHIEK